MKTFLLVLLSLPQALWAAGVGITKSELLEKCYSFDKAQSSWFRKCASWDDFAKEVDAKKLPPEHRLLFSRLALDEIRRLRESILIAPPPKPRFMARPVLIKDPSEPAESPRNDLFSLFDKGQRYQEVETLGDSDQSVFGSEPVEGEFFKATAPILSSIETWLTPLDTKGNVLQADAAFVKLLSYGESLRFEKAMQTIKARWKEISSSPLHQREVYQRVATWTRSFGAIPLRDWFYDEMIRVRPSKITGRRQIELFYYLESLRLSQPNLDSPVAVESTLKILRSLWIVHTSKEERDEISALVRSLRLQSKFKAPQVDDMTPEELLLQVQSYVRRLDGDSALKTVSQILKDAQKSKLTEDNLWETFQVHIRILRIMDRRSEIPELIRVYSVRGKYFDLPTSGPNVERVARRLFEIAKLEWTYGSHDRALGLLQRLQSFSKDKPLSKGLSTEIMYVKARILEQGKEKDIADVVISDALASKLLTREQEYDLRWRLFFLRINSAYVKRDFSKLGPELDAIAPLANDPFEVLRLNYWRGTLALYQEKKPLAKEWFSKVYAAEPMSYYGNLAALGLQALGEEVSHWLKPAEKDIKEPDWSHFVDDKGHLKDGAYKPLARALILLKSGSNDWLGESLDDLSSQLWAYVPSKKAASLTKRLAYARASMWLFTDAGEPMSALRAADIVVTQLKEETPYDLKFLYPLAFWDFIQKYSADQKLDPWFVVSLIRQESAFKVDARSWANALGLMQMIPPVAQNDAKLMGITDFENESLLGNPELSIRLGTHHIGGLYRRFEGSWMCILAGYNAGYPPVMDWLGYYPSPIPLTFVERISYTETRLYVMTIFRNFMNYRRIHGDGKVSLAELNQITQH